MEGLPTTLAQSKQPSKRCGRLAGFPATLLAVPRQKSLCHLRQFLPRQPSIQRKADSIARGDGLVEHRFGSLDVFSASPLGEHVRIPVAGDRLCRNVGHGLDAGDRGAMVLLGPRPVAGAGRGDACRGPDGKSLKAAVPLGGDLLRLNL